MCSRFELTLNYKDLEKKLCSKKIPQKYKSGEIRPTDPILCLNGTEAFINRWGIKVSWSNSSLINARSETLLDKKTFRPLLDSRCLVLATAYFEWRISGKKHLKNRISLTNGELFAFAGLTNGQHAVILTCRPAPSIAHIHNRMPIILSQTSEKAWINKSYPIEAALKQIITDHNPSIISKEEFLTPSHQGELFEYNTKL